MSSLLEEKTNFHLWIKKVRDEFSVDVGGNHIEGWEALVCVAITYLKNILDFMVANMRGKGLGIAKIISSGPFQYDIAWVALIQLPLSILFLNYLYLKYGRKFFLWDVLCFWVFATSKSIRGAALFNRESQQIMGLMINIGASAFIIIFLLGIDRANIAALKLFLFDNLAYDPNSNTYYHTVNTKFSPWKVLKLCGNVFFITLVMLLLMKIINVIIYMTGVKGEGQESESINQSRVISNIKTNALDSFIHVVIIAPLVEEAVMRLALMRMCKHKGWSIFGSGFIFGLIHLNNEPAIYIINYMMPGLIFGFVYWVCRNIWPTIFIHSLNNIVAFANIMVHG